MTTDDIMALAKDIAVAAERGYEWEPHEAAIRAAVAALVAERDRRTVRLGEDATENDMSDQTLWIAGKLRGHAADGTPAWDLQGVFDTEAAADAACVDGADFIGPVPLNKPLPQDATSWPGCRYPRATIEEWISHDQARKRREAEQTPDDRLLTGDGRTA